MQKLTKTIVEELKLPEKGQKLFWDKETRGFGVRLTPGGKVFIAQGLVNGKDRRVKIGPFGTWTVDEARKKAKQYLLDMANGIDPNAQKKIKVAQGKTLLEVGDDYISDRDLKPSSIKDIRKHLNNTFSAWKDKPINLITRDIVLKLYRTRSEISPAQSNQAFRILRALLNYAMATYRPNNKPVIPENPVQVLSDAKVWNNIEPKNRRIPLDKVGTAWNMLTKMRYDPAQTLAALSIIDAVCFCLLTGCRWGEAQSLTWQHVSTENKTWHIEDPKNKKRVTLPLSTQAHEIISTRPRVEGNQHVFCSNKSKTGHIGPGRFITDQLAKYLKVELSPHDLRRTFRAIAAEIDIELWRTKLLMNHKIQNDITIQAYTEKSDLEYLRPSIQKIGDWIERQGKIAASDKVVDINKSRDAIAVK